MKILSIIKSIWGKIVNITTLLNVYFLCQLKWNTFFNFFFFLSKSDTPFGNANWSNAHKVKEKKSFYFHVSLSDGCISILPSNFFATFDSSALYLCFFILYFYTYIYTWIRQAISIFNQWLKMYSPKNHFTFISFL